jgi:uncharacterized membrane protein (DUF2068 family)
MTREELQKKIEVERELSRLAIERADAHMREFRRQAAIHTVTTDRLLQDLQEVVRRR